MGVFAFVAQELFKKSFVPSLDSVFLASGVAALSWGILYLWYRSYRRWGTFVEITHRRMHEIERELGMWKNRDVEIVDTIIQNRDSDWPTDTDADKAHVSEVTRWATRLTERGRLMATSIHDAVRGMVALLLFGWLCAVTYLVPANALAFNKWYLSAAVVAVPALWFAVPAIRERWLK
jgi:hypothetical protein